MNGILSIFETAVVDYLLLASITAALLVTFSWGLIRLGSPVCFGLLRAVILIPKRMYEDTSPGETIEGVAIVLGPVVNFPP